MNKTGVTMTKENLVFVKISSDGYILEMKNVSDIYRYQHYPQEENE